MGWGSGIREKSIYFQNYLRRQFVKECAHLSALKNVRPFTPLHFPVPHTEFKRKPCICPTERVTYIIHLSQIIRTSAPLSPLLLTPLWCRPKSGSDERILTLALDGSQTIRYVKAKILEALEVRLKNHTVQHS